jgi:non-specific serine/threonine protein kinase/protein-serine/threonine kinase
VSVVRGEPVGGAQEAPGIHFEHLVRLRHWVAPLQVPESQLSLHVIEALSPSGTLLEFARNNNVDLIVIGAPSPDQQALAWWRSVASSVTAGARCSVYVVRLPEPG